MRAAPLCRGLPANCIYIEAAENTRQFAFLPTLRQVYNIDYNAASSAATVSSLPTDAITTTRLRAGTLNAPTWSCARKTAGAVSALTAQNNTHPFRDR